MSNKANKKSQSPSAIGDKTAHVDNLRRKGNWVQIRKLANEGIQAAVDAINARANEASAAKDEKAKNK